MKMFDESRLKNGKYQSLSNIGDMAEHIRFEPFRSVKDCSSFPHEIPEFSRIPHLRGTFGCDTIGFSRKQFYNEGDDRGQPEWISSLNIIRKTRLDKWGGSRK